MARPVRFVLVLLAVVLAACGTPAESSASGDGVLDCDEGQVHRGADIRVSGSTETEVVEDALAEWVEEGAEILELPGDESWAAVENGRDVAIAYPEVEGDGAWVVYDVQVCGEPDTGPAPTDGSLDCANEAGWNMQASFDPDIPGDPNPKTQPLRCCRPTRMPTEARSCSSTTTQLRLLSTIGNRLSSPQSRFRVAVGRSRPFLVARDMTFRRSQDDGPTPRRQDVPIGCVRERRSRPMC